MRVILEVKNLEFTDALKIFVEKKFISLKKFINILKQDTPQGLKTLAEVFVEVEKETRHHKKGKIYLVKTQVVLPGKILTARAKEDDLFKAIVSARKELKLEIGKYKFKKKDKNRREQRKAKNEMKM